MREHLLVKLLLIDDDVALVASLQRGLKAEGYTVDVAHNGIDGLWMATEGGFDLILLDLMLPGRNGFQVCAELRKAENWTPVLMLTAKVGDMDQAEALDTGADDYLTKPFSYPVLLAHIRALLRRTTSSEVPPKSVGDLHLDSAKQSVRRGATSIDLTARQFQVLEFLVRRAGDVVSKEQILDGVWEHDYDGDPNIVEVYIRRLRVAIDKPFDRHSIETIRGAGYRLVDERARG